MPETNLPRALLRLYRIIDASEKGFFTAAACTPDDAQKILYCFFAQQRLVFKTDILTELRQSGLAHRPAPSLPGAVHRGRVAIFAGMAIDAAGKRASVLREVMVGERVAERTYQQTLDLDLPPETHALIARQFETVRKTPERIAALAAIPDPPNNPVTLLTRLGVTPEELERIPLNRLTTYPGPGATLLEVILSGIVGGALWGGLMGIFAGFGVVQTAGPLGLPSPALAWLMVALAFAVGGGFISAILALFIGLGITQEDRAHYLTLHQQH